MEQVTYSHYIRKKWIVLFVTCLFLFFLGLINLSFGTSRLSILEIWQIVTGGGETASRVILLQIRLPRTLMAMGVGIALSMAGAVMQSVLRNPLASASTLGISQGASFGAAVAIILFDSSLQFGTGALFLESRVHFIPLFAFLGGVSTTIVILLLSYQRGMRPATMLLAGVSIGAMFTALTALVQYFANDIQIGSIVYWTFGNLGRAGFGEIRLLFLVNAIGFLYFMANRFNYNAMQSGTATAKSLGVNVTTFIPLSMLMATLVSATAISFVGTIGFIGLIAPHIARKLVGGDYRFLIPVSAFMGASVMLLADLASRMIRPPVVLPIGALTSLLAAPLFLYFIIRKRGLSQ